MHPFWLKCNFSNWLVETTKYRYSLLVLDEYKPILSQYLFHQPISESLLASKIMPILYQQNSWLSILRTLGCLLTAWSGSSVMVDGWKLQNQISPATGPWLFRVCRGWNATQLCRDYKVTICNHYKLGCPPSQRQWQMKVYRDSLLNI